MRTEKDHLGVVSFHDTCYYGIQTQRAVENFKLSENLVRLELIHAMVLVKKAAAMAHKELKSYESDKAEAIIKACDLLLEGAYDNQFVTAALQGGAGTSTHMNINEVVANLALELMGHPKGAYHIIHPLDEVNRSQSTNDVYPTALRIAAIRQLRKTAAAFHQLQAALQILEEQFASVLKLGRTQLMDALPMTLGQSFGAYARAVSRDRWRIYKVEERLREINIGGTAIGTGLNATNAYIFKVTDLLQEITGLGLARSEYPIDSTQNMDVFVEVSGLLKAASVNLIKISGDLRLMNSGPRGGLGEITLPERQAGSTIMPGKINPVMAEMIAQVGMKVIANDSAITQAASMGQFELNAFAPLIADALLESLSLLEKGVVAFTTHCIKGITANVGVCLSHVENSTVLATALVHHLGYEVSAKLACEALETHKSIRTLVLEQELLADEVLDQILKPHQITNPGIPGLSTKQRSQNKESL